MLQKVASRRREALWDEVVEAEPSLASMQDQNQRTFPVVVLEPEEVDEPG